MSDLSLSLYHIPQIRDKTIGFHALHDLRCSVLGPHKDSKGVQSARRDSACANHGAPLSAQPVWLSQKLTERAAPARDTAPLSAEAPLAYLPPLLRFGRPSSASPLPVHTLQGRGGDMEAKVRKILPKDEQVRLV